MYCECPDADEIIVGIKIKNVKARKEHGCDECGVAIKKGDIYERLMGWVRGDPFIHKTCAFCAHVRSDLQSYGFCTLYGTLWDDIAMGEEEAAEEEAWNERYKALKREGKDITNDK